MLLVLGPILVIAWLLHLARKRVQRAERDRGDSGGDAGDVGAK
jgi:hypothetical protein